MKLIQLQFVSTDTKLQAGELSMAKSLKQVLISVVSMGMDKPAPSLRILWRALDDLESSEDAEEVKIGQSEYELVKDAWDAHLPKAQVGYRWLQATDLVLQTAKEIKE